MTRKKEVLVTGSLGQGENCLGRENLVFNRILRLGDKIGVNASVARKDGLTFKEEVESVKRADLVVVIAESGSLDAGSLARVGFLFRKPMILAFDEGRKVSRMIRGLPNLVAEIVYSSPLEMEEALGFVFSRLRDVQGGRKRKKLERLLFSGSPPSALKPPLISNCG